MEGQYSGPHTHMKLDELHGRLLPGTFVIQHTTCSFILTGLLLQGIPHNFERYICHWYQSGVVWPRNLLLMSRNRVSPIFCFPSRVICLTGPSPAPSYLLPLEEGARPRPRGWLTGCSPAPSHYLLEAAGGRRGSTCHSNNLGYGKCRARLMRTWDDVDRKYLDRKY